MAMASMNPKRSSAGWHGVSCGSRVQSFGKGAFSISLHRAQDFSAWLR